MALRSLPARSHRPAHGRTGLELSERPADASDDGRQVPQDAEVVMGILRDGALLRFGDGHPLTVRAGDRLVTVRPAASKAGEGS